MMCLLNLIAISASAATVTVGISLQWRRAWPEKGAIEWHVTFRTHMVSIRGRTLILEPTFPAAGLRGSLMINEYQLLCPLVCEIILMMMMITMMRCVMSGLSGIVRHVGYGTACPTGPLGVVSWRGAPLTAGPLRPQARRPQHVALR